MTSIESAIARHLAQIEREREAIAALQACTLGSVVSVGTLQTDETRADDIARRNAIIANLESVVARLQGEQASP